MIVFSSQDFEEFAVGNGRDYHLVFFLNANYLAGNAKMNLPKLRQEFGLAAKVTAQHSDRTNYAGARPQALSSLMSSTAIELRTD